MSKRKSKPAEKPSLKEKVAESLGASKEVILDAPRIIFIGNRELTVENYKSIGEYSDNLIVLETNPHQLKIKGTELEIKSIARELIYITGKVSAVEFKREV
ncbi:MAG: sporulation protein YqfC [Clostridia bacterium]|nr:sporulation protein YqfC [Clostridia bacterium]